MSNGFATVAQNFRDLAEYFDNLSEDARDSAERTKAAALNKLGPPFKQNLINGLGAATTDQQRCAAAKAVLDAFQAMLDEMMAAVEDAGGEAAMELLGPTPETLAAINCLRAFYEDLVKIKTFETQRDAFRGVADVFAGM